MVAPPPPPEAAGPASELIMVSGNNQQAVAGSELPSPLVVKVLDAKGKAVSGQGIGFVVTLGGGQVFAGTATSNADGIAQDRWTIGPSVADSQRVEARSVNSVTGQALPPAVFRASSMSGIPKALVGTPTNTLVGTVAQLLLDSLVVRVTDSNGNPVAGVVVGWATGPASGAVNPATSSTNPNGVASAKWIMGTVVGAQSASATVQNVGTASFTATARAGPVAQLWKVRGDNQSAQPRRPLSDSLVVRVTDAYGNPIAGIGFPYLAGNFGFTWVYESGDGELHWGGNTTDVAGLIAANYIVGDVPGPQGVTIRLPGIPSVTFSESAIGIKYSLISAGENHTCAIAADRSMYCWGGNQYGAVGSGNPLFNSPRPEKVSGSLSFVQVGTSQDRSCGLVTNGKLYCWGSTLDGTSPDQRTPSEIPGGKTYRNFALGGGHVCAIGTDDMAYCMGYNDMGQTGTTTAATTWITSPAPIVGPGLTSVAAGFAHTCGLTSDGTAYCWGENAAGQLGTGNTTRSSIPILVSTSIHFLALAAGSSHTCGVSLDRRTYCWGTNSSDQLGDGSGASHFSPSPISDTRQFVLIDAGTTHTCANTMNGESFCWGRTLYGGSVSGLPSRIVRSISAGHLHTCAVSEGGAAYCWGHEYPMAGQLGTPDQYTNLVQQP
jgi:alpha-tubulin suppressor-like RCC1 family protein